MCVCRARPEAIGVRGGVGGGAAEGYVLGFLKPVLRFRAEQNDVGKSQMFAQPVEMLAGPAVFF